MEQQLWWIQQKLWFVDEMRLFRKKQKYHTTVPGTVPCRSYSVNCRPKADIHLYDMWRVVSHISMHRYLYIVKVWWLSGVWTGLACGMPACHAGLNFELIRIIHTIQTRLFLKTIFFWFARFSWCHDYVIRVPFASDLLRMDHHHHHLHKTWSSASICYGHRMMYSTGYGRRHHCG